MDLSMWFLNEVDWLLVACLLTAAASVPLALRMVPPNALYGFRTRFMRSNPSVWYAVNALVGRGMLIASMLSALVLLFAPVAFADPLAPVGIVVVPIGLVTLAGWVYLRHLREMASRR
jgi:hypothetical protein